MKTIKLPLDDHQINNLRFYAATIDAENAEMMGCSCCKTNTAHLYYEGITGTKDQPMDMILATVMQYHEESIEDLELNNSILTVKLLDDHDQQNYNDFLEELNKPLEEHVD
jgi:hypothetical protein